MNKLNFVLSGLSVSAINFTWQSKIVPRRCIVCVVPTVRGANGSDAEIDDTGNAYR